MFVDTRRFRVAALLATIAIVGACESQPLLEPSGEALLQKSATQQGSAEQQLKAVRQVTARFHSTTQAERAGYEIEHFCVAVPGLGGMGQHWANPELVDPIFDPLQPEVMLYAPGPNGKPQLVAVEYLVVNVGQPHPHFGDRPFDIGGTPAPFPHWSLHVWLYETNPSGTFAPFNPNVECH